jgi:hypothetical protein
MAAAPLVSLPVALHGSMPGPSRAGTARADRLAADGRLLAKHYPALTHTVLEDGTATVAGPIAVPRPDGSAEHIQMLLVFDRAYPKRPPHAFDVAGRWAPTLRRHIEANRRFCLSLEGIDDPDLEASPAALLDYIADLRSFLDQQLIFDSLLKHNPNATFPGREWGHGTIAYAEYAARVLGRQRENVAQALWKVVQRTTTRLSDPCPCGSNRTIGECHREPFKQLRRALRIARQRDMPFDIWPYERLMKEQPDHD